MFKERDAWYAVALEFNMVESGDDPREVLLRLFEAVRGYVRSARKAKLSSDILNQEPDPEYEAMWEGRKTPKPSIYTFGEQPLRALANV